MLEVLDCRLILLQYRNFGPLLVNFLWLWCHYTDLAVFHRIHIVLECLFALFQFSFEFQPNPLLIVSLFFQFCKLWNPFPVGCADDRLFRNGK